MANYRDAKMVNEKRENGPIHAKERRVLTGSLHTCQDIHGTFNFHKCGRMARDPRGVWPRRLCGSSMLPMLPLSRAPFLSGHCASGAFERNYGGEKVVILWLADHLLRDGESVEWVATPRLGIRKATLNFVAKFFWLLVRNRVLPIKADNQVTWDRAVMVATLVAGVEINFARLLLAEIHERASKISTTYPFPCLIFQLCRDSRVPIWHCDRLIYPTGELDIGLIRDEANVAAPRREPQVESITEFEARVERRMEDMMDRKVQAVNNHLDALVRVLGDRPGHRSLAAVT
ncbi:hypothetical protein H5410_050535 [Solanum commersonii]|uniref:Putative plant transposon protein domain-containing protein n=1 Tax=Solanum commersonii TaxID=4109 RepID=A0A9J5WXV6_SOLCO|nr:hypothetical protein H5410_050535 [Solanum commersonii]